MESCNHQPRAFQISKRDTVAVLLQDAAPGDIQLFGAAEGVLRIHCAIKLGHKVAVKPCEAGDAVYKYGVRIGHATQTIAPGEWVHLHNLASDLDERSGSLDHQTGVSTDMKYE